MKTIVTIFLMFLLVPGIVYAKADRHLDVGVTISADPNVHQAIYAVLKAKGISCSGLSTRKDGTVTIIKASSDEPKITAAEIQAEITKIEQAVDVEAKIQKKIREIAIRELKTDKEIPDDYKDK